jgi:hypothetical protein
MKKRIPTLSLMLLVLAPAVAEAQPDPYVQPEASNPVNRPAGRNDYDREQRLRQALEFRVRRMLAASGVTDKGVQDAVSSCMHDEDATLQTVLDKVKDLAQTLRSYTAADADVAAALNDLRSDWQDYESSRGTAERALDDRVHYSRNSRLKAALLLMGAIGDAPAAFPGGEGFLDGNATVTGKGGVPPRPDASQGQRKQWTKAVAAGLTKPRMSLLRALDAAVQSQTDANFKTIASTIQDEVSQGIRLSAALSEFPTVFDDDYVEVVRQAELTGRLAEALAGLAARD